MLNIITRCTRTKNLLQIKDSIFKNVSIEVKWYLIFDTSSIKDIDANLLSKIQDKNTIIKYYNGFSGDYGHNLINITIDEIESGWIYILDDDNILHENFIDNLIPHFTSNYQGIIFSQFVGGKDFTGLNVRDAIPENIKVQKIDMAQFILKRELIANKRLKTFEYKADGYFIEELYKENPDKFLILNEVLSYYNYFQSPKMPISLPKVLILGENINIKSRKLYDYEEDRLNTKFTTNDKVLSDLVSFNPDSIISIGESYEKFTNLVNQPLDIRLRWVHSDKINNDLGEIAYLSSMNYILNGQDDNNPLISFFTPFYNTGDKLTRTYESLKNQTWSNWEWVLVNDSSDEGKTLKIAESLAKNDSRIKIFDFREKSNGIIGESKYRAAAMSKGKYIMELDHDDIITKDAGELMIKAFKAHPDAKFVYSDCAEIDENYQSLTYGDGFAFGYGKYRNEFYNNRMYKVAVCQNINPKTIRHIVGVPNHFRAWDREFYHSIGGHNRRLTIADDYELIVRSFLKTKFVCVRKLCYLQFFHNSNSLNNTQDSCRADIQRRVRTISNHYNLEIKERFEELGVSDWAYEGNPNNPLLTESRFGEEEGYVNYIFNPETEYIDEYLI